MQKHLPDIEKILNSLQGAEYAEPKPYLLTRVNAALAAREKPALWSQVVLLLQKPAIAFSLVAIILLFNIGFLFLKNNQAGSSSALIQKTTGVDFAINVNSIYDIENIDQ